MVPIRTWIEGSFRLELFDTETTDHLGKCRLAYRFIDGDKLIFEGSDFCCSPCHAIDSNECVAGLLGFLSLRPGDTDAEYFDNYTPEQMAWCQERGEELSIYAMELEENE